MKKLIRSILIAMLLWAAISNGIQAFKKPEMSQTELFMHLPNSLICDWKAAK